MLSDKLLTENEILMKKETYGESTICCIFNRLYKHPHIIGLWEPVIWVCVYDPNDTTRRTRNGWSQDDLDNIPYIEPPCTTCNSKEYKLNTVKNQRDCIYAAWKGWLVSNPLPLEEMINAIGNLRMDKMSPE